MPAANPILPVQLVTEQSGISTATGHISLSLCVTRFCLTLCSPLSPSLFPSSSLSLSLSLYLSLPLPLSLPSSSLPLFVSLSLSFSLSLSLWRVSPQWIDRLSHSVSQKVAGTLG